MNVNHAGFDHFCSNVADRRNGAEEKRIPSIRDVEAMNWAKSQSSDLQSDKGADDKFAWRIASSILANVGCGINLSNHSHTHLNFTKFSSSLAANIGAKFSTSIQLPSYPRDS